MSLKPKPKQTKKLSKSEKQKKLKKYAEFRKLYADMMNEFDKGNLLGYFEAEKKVLNFKWDD